MAGVSKPTAREAFDYNVADAETLVLLAEALQNKRVRRMRQERRETLGEALGIPKRDWDHLDCIESADLFAIFSPGSRLNRETFQEKSLRPLLRQALVAGCAALETFVGDRVMELLRGALDLEERPTRLLSLPMTVEDWLWIEENYQRKRWGLREVIEWEVRNIASPAPSQIGQAFGIVGQKKLWKRVDARRGTASGGSEEVLDRLYERRNQIAHSGDRVGRGRATISSDEVREDLECLVEVVDALDAETAP
ncbi:MAG TPA: HEPN domain-containing protein [Vicinamibacteria bacterium]